jgi:hypothetical protein
MGEEYGEIRMLCPNFGEHIAEREGPVVEPETSSEARL